MANEWTWTMFKYLLQLSHLTGVIKQLFSTMTVDVNILLVNEKEVELYFRIENVNL